MDSNTIPPFSKIWSRRQFLSRGLLSIAAMKFLTACENTTPITPPQTNWSLTLPAPGSIGAISSNTMFDLTTDPNEQFVFSKLLGAFSGAAVSLIRNASGQVVDFLYFVFGTGHGDGGHDGGFAFRASTGQLERFSDPSAAVVARGFMAENSTDIVYGETIAGRPDPQHTYFNLQGLDNNEPNGPSFTIVYSAAVGKSAFSSSQAHKIDVATKTWERWGNLGNRNDTVAVYVVLKDTLRQRWVLIPSNEGSAVWLKDYTLANADWVLNSSSVGTFRSGFGWNATTVQASGCYDPIGDLYIAGTMQGGTALRTLAAADYLGAWVTLNTTGAAPSNLHGISLEYASTEDFFFVVDTDSSTINSVYILEPPTTGNRRTGLWTWSRRTFSGVSRFFNASPAPSVYNRFRYVPAPVHGIVVIPAGDQPVEVWRF
jgi:hypothetical protein